MRNTAAVCLCAVLLGGCSSVNVVKNPSPGDNGIRFYRPKPYLMVTPADPTGRMVKLEIMYLPDYCEEYSIHPRGKKPPAVQLKDGWNLVGVGGGGGGGGGGAAPAVPPTDPIKLPENVLVAGNVPIGLYESVFDSTGPSKYLKGWRYVGFTPLGGGGLPNGTDAAATARSQQGCPNNCQSPGSVVQGPLYGLVFFNGAMTFRQLDEIANNMTCPEYRKPIFEPVPPSGGSDVRPVEEPRPSGSEVVPTAPSPSPPKPAAYRAPKRSMDRLDAGVAQASAMPRAQSTTAVATWALKAPTAKAPTAKAPTAKAPTVKAPTAKAPTAKAPTTKPVDMKRLKALEDEVFKSLNYTPSTTTKGTSAVRSNASAGSSSSPLGVPSASRASSSSDIPELTPATLMR